MARPPVFAAESALVLLVALLALASWAAPARAVIHPAAVLDGPSNAILEVNGAAMAPDGSGGILYRKEVEGVAHVFVAPFRDGLWGTPVQVDSEDAYGASEPAIAAGEGGRLLVVWVQERNVNISDIAEYSLMGAAMQPGASGFGQAIIVDPDVGEPDTGDISGVDPRLAMAPDGAAYVVYRAILDDCALGDESNPELGRCRPGGADKVVSVRVARYDYLTWSSLGQINRAPQIAMRDPTAENAPSIGISLNGNGVVAWQEPDSGDVARIWARRLFGTVRGSVLEISPQTLGGRQVSTDADAPAVAVGPYGETQIAFRVLGASGSAIATTSVYTNSILSEIAPHGSEPRGASLLGTGSGLGPPSAAIDQEGGAFRVSWTAGGAVRELEGSNRSAGSSVTVGAGVGPAPTIINPAGGGTTAWSAQPGQAPAAQVREDYAGGAFQGATLAGGVAGAIGGLSLGGDGKGDALIGFSQGPPGQAEVLGAFVQAPPAPFVLDLPNGWVRGGDATITWESSFDAVPGVTYTVYVDGRPRLGGLTGLSTRLSATGLGDGVHRVQVLATDASGQQTMSAGEELKVDAGPPIVSVRSIEDRRGVRVTVRSDASGVDARATQISFGDGHETKGRASVSHVYARAGVYMIVAHVRDRVGNHATVRLRVRAL